MSVAPAPARVPADRPPAGGSRVGILAIVGVTLVIYLMPSALANRTGSSVPALFAPDLSLYLNLSRLAHAAPGIVVNPWYGVSVRSASLVYRKFGLSFAAFHLLWVAIAKSWWRSLLLWDALWTALIAVCAWRLLRRLGVAAGWSTSAALALLMLVDLHSLPAIPGAWLHLPSAERFTAFSLPFMRSFFPQVAIPFLLLYLENLLDLISGQASPRRWIWAALLQAITFAIYPYATLLMAGATAFAGLVAIATAAPRPGVLKLATFAAACGAMDLIYLLAVGFPTAGGAGRTALLHFDPALFLHLAASKTLALTVILAIAAALLTRRHPEIRISFSGLGLTAAVMLVADAVVSPGLQVSHHALFLLQPVLALLLIGIAAELATRLPQRALPGIAAFATAIFIAHGALSAYGNYLSMRGFNGRIAESAAVLQSSGLTSRDLVIAPAETVDDLAAWVPLLSPASVLFCRNAEFVLSPEQEATAQLPREAAYLYMTGRDRAWLAEALSTQTPVEQQNFLAPTQSRLLLEGPHRAAALADLRRQLGPLLSPADAGDPAVSQLFAGYDRVLVLDAPDRPLFHQDRLARYLQPISDPHSGTIRFRWYKPLATVK